MMIVDELLIAKKSIRAFSEQEYRDYVSSMYYLAGKKSISPISGITLCKSKAGNLFVRGDKSRKFKYVTWTEIDVLAKTHNMNKSDLWILFKRRKFIIAKTRAEAEGEYRKCQKKNVLM